LTAKSGDQFFSATGGAGYTYPWSLPKPAAYFDKVTALNKKYMPADVWIDVWEGGCPRVPGVPASAVGQNPCLDLYQTFADDVTVGGFSQWCNGCNHTSDPHYVYNSWLDDGTPVFLQPASMWYPTQKGFCNQTDGGHGLRPSAQSLVAEADCVETPWEPRPCPGQGLDRSTYEVWDFALEIPRSRT
jgi:hypothetical protein